MSPLCSIDGNVGPVADGQISITDDGFLRGDGGFEVLRLYGGKPFALKDHLDRLDRSANGVFLEWDRAAFEREIEALLDANDEPDASLRLVVTRGGRRIAIVEKPAPFEHGLTLQSVTYQPTIVLTGLKTLSYEANMTATRIAMSRGADEALLVLPGGRVLEAPTSTIFWASEDGAIRTPKLDAGILASITRDRIMKVAPVAESDEYKLKDSEKTVSLVFAVGEALAMMKEEGLQNVHKRHARLGAAVRAGAQAIGWTLFSKSPANSVTALEPPAGVDASAVVKRLRETHGITVAGGQDHTKGKMLRIGHMGAYDLSDIYVVLGALEECTGALGRGSATGAIEAARRAWEAA